jgi:hypothetical protein
MDQAVNSFGGEEGEEVKGRNNGDNSDDGRQWQMTPDNFRRMQTAVDNGNDGDDGDDGR